jgi:hypothetical protein
VLGNHDLWTDHALLEDALARAGVELLVNQHTPLGDDLVLVGLDEPWTGELDVAAAMSRIGATELPMRSWSPPEVAVFELVQRDA